MRGAAGNGGPYRDGVRVCRDKTGLELGMKESYEEGLANHFGLQRRGVSGNNVVLSVRAEGQAGQLLSSEITTFACRPYPHVGKATSRVSLQARHQRTRRSPGT